VLSATMQDPADGSQRSDLSPGSQHQRQPTSAGSHPDFHSCRTSAPGHQGLKRQTVVARPEVQAVSFAAHLVDGVLLGPVDVVDEAPDGFLKLF
jgi:hypothetical protein